MHSARTGRFVQTGHRQMWWPRSGVPGGEVAAHPLDATQPNCQDREQRRRLGGQVARDRGHHAPSTYPVVGAFGFNFDRNVAEAAQ